MTSKTEKIPRTLKLKKWNHKHRIEKNQKGKKPKGKEPFILLSSFENFRKSFRKGLPHNLEIQSKVMKNVFS